MVKEKVTYHSLLVKVGKEIDRRLVLGENLGKLQDVYKDILSLSSDYNNVIK